MTSEPSVDVLAAQVREALRRASVFLDDALEESDLTEDEMYEAPGTFYVRLLAAKTSLTEVPEALAVLVGYAKRAEEAEQQRKRRPVTHGRHCKCSACAREDWTRITVPCGMHGPGCPAVYAPIDGGYEDV